MDINELESYRLSDAVKFNDHLNPRLWGQDEKLLPEVREKLMAIADDFREFLGINGLDVKDITVSGSNAAYTYTPHSDIDLHLVVDTPNGKNTDVYRELFDAKKYQYNDQHNYKIGGYDVELYVQDANQVHHSQGIYSVLNNDWVSVPRRRQPNIDDISVRSKFEDIGHRIEQAIASGDKDKMAAIAAKVKDMRQAGLDSTGEFGPENLAFKALRTQGLLDQLRTARNAAKDQELSLQERKKKKKQTQRGYGGYWYPGFSFGDSEGSGDGGGGESVRENTKSPDIKQILQPFIDSCVEYLGIEQAPKIVLKRDPEWTRRNGTFGSFDPDTYSVTLAVSGRHVLDILRTLAHELTHARQDEQADMPVDAGETGSPYEDEANAMAGRIMRHWVEQYPEFFKDIPLEESVKDKLAAAAAAACIAGTTGCATTGADAIRTVQDVGRTAQTIKHMGRAGAEEEIMQRLKNELRRRQGHVVPEAVTESLDQPYKILRWEKGDYGDVDAIARLPDGTFLSVMFTKGFSQETKEEAWSVEFFRNNSQEKTGEGDQQRVFATVLSAVQTFVSDRVPGAKGRYKPNKIFFSASKEVKPDEDQRKAMTRARLYDSLVQRYARALGFRAFRADTGKQVMYELSRIKPVTEGAQNDLSTIIQSFVASPLGQKYKQYDCKTVTRAFVQWAEQNKIPTQVVSLAPPSADFIAKNPRYKGKSGQGDGHIMPIVNGNAIDFTVRQFGINRPFNNPLVTPTSSLPAIYGKFGYFTDKPEWFLGGKSHWIGALNSIPSEIFNQNFGDELLEHTIAENLTQGRNLSPITKKYVQDHNWKLTTVNPMSLDIDGFDDPFNRVIDIDTDHPVNFKDPIIVHANGTTIIDGFHRVYQAQLQGLEQIPAYVPIEQRVAEDAKTTEHYNGIEISMEKEDDEITVTAMMPGGRELGHVLFVIDGEYLAPQDLEVDERYQGQGIAATMYDYVKSKGYKIRRSGQQTDAGAGFWDKHRPEQNVWEQRLAEATGYIPVNDKEARDPRYSMAITVDIKPGEVQRQARKMGWTTDAAGRPPLLTSNASNLRETQDSNMKIAHILKEATLGGFPVKVLRIQDQGVEEAGNANSGRRGSTHYSPPDSSPVTLGRVEKTAGGVRHHADPSRYGGYDPKPEDDRLLGPQSRWRLDRAVRGLNEFAPLGSGDGREPDEEAILRRLAAQWWLGTEQQMAKAQKTLAAMGWDIGQDESGDDDAGVFVIRAGDENGDSYIAFNHSELEELNEAYNNYHANRTGFRTGARDPEGQDPQASQQVWGLKINGKVWSKQGKDVTFTSKQAAINTMNAILKNRPDLQGKIGLVTRGGVAEGLNEFAPGAGGDDGDADPYRYPKPTQFNRSVDYFGQFEADHFDREDFDDTTGVFKGYWGNTQIAYFKFDNPEKTGSDDPGMGWYYEPESDSSGNSTSASTTVDNSDQRKQQELNMINAFLKSGQQPKPGSQIYALMKKHGLAEGSVAKKPQPYNDPNWTKKLSKDQLDAIAGPRYKKDKKDKKVLEGEGRFAGDTPVNIGGATVKRMAIGDTVTYFGRRAKIVDMTTDRKMSRITIANDMGGITKDVLTSDLKRTGVAEAIKLNAPQRTIPRDELQGYADRIKTGTKTKRDKFAPIIHGSNIKAITKDDENTEWDLDDLSRQITTRPKAILGTNAKMEKSKTEGEIIYDLTLPALSGIVVDEDTGDFVEITTCPGAGQCQLFCYARKGGYVMFPASSMSAAQALNFLVNDPEGYSARVNQEIKAVKARADKAGIQLVVRWHDAGDFFSKEYLDLAYDVAKSNSDVQFYAYTKMGDVATGAAPANFTMNFSSGSKRGEEKKVEFYKQQNPGATVKQGVTVPKDMFFDLIARKGNSLIKDAKGRTQFSSPEALNTFKQRIAQQYKVAPDSIITYDQMLATPVGPTPKWNVIVQPGAGDRAANRKDVIDSYLMFH